MILNHLGTLHLGQGDEEDKKNLQYWRDGMKALASQSNVTVKLSMLGFVRKDWGQEQQSFQEVKSLVRETIELFGSNRCMFASNFPVDRVGNGTFSAVGLYSKFEELVSDLDYDSKAQLFSGTAKQVYQLNAL